MEGGTIMAKRCALWFAGRCRPHVVCVGSQGAGAASHARGHAVRHSVWHPHRSRNRAEGDPAAEAEAKKHNWKMAISVVDTHGELFAHATIDGIIYGS
jgi:hypothetical protein